MLNGELRLAEEALVPVSGALASFGEGALEVFRTTAHGPFLASRHLARLRRTCQRLDIPAAGLEQDLVHDLGMLSLAGKGPWRVRLLRSRTDDGVMRALVAEPFAPSALLEVGARLTMREGIVTPLAMKTTSYVTSRVFSREARGAGFDECLLHFGDELLEGASSNIVLVKQGVLVSPMSPWILEGVTLRRVVELAAELGINTDRRRVRVSELALADEVFMTSAIRGPIPVRQVDGQPFRLGSVFAALRSRYEEDLRSDWGELRQEMVPGSRVFLEKRLSSLGQLKDEELDWGGETFLLRWSMEGAEIRIAAPSAGSGLKLRSLGEALRNDHR
ncbi:MAG: branched-subunit amino acid aminotransferase/4-amino-4-deoxychorismate lyase [Polyangiales bacterium]